MELNLKTKIDNYQIPQDAIKVVQDTPILLIAGIAGAGKDSIIQKLLNTEEYHYIVSDTTRAPRANNGVVEQDGVDYHFRTAEEATVMMENHEFVEAKDVHGNLYGTTIDELKKARDLGKIAVTDIDVQGVAEYKNISPSVISIFILPPTYDVWLQRLTARYDQAGANNADISNRKQSAIAELEESLAKSYYHYVINEDLEQATKAVDSIAHHHDEFTIIDRSFHVWAERLLHELRVDS